ncbi:MAG: hypothetical protein ACXAB7_13820 [Candidatus Kariarchaeaceae archaeon]|jgi:hypothetical protein
MSNLGLKRQLISLLEIAEINLLMSIKNLTQEREMKKVHTGANSILKIFVHCARQIDFYIAKYTGETILPHPKKPIEELIAGGFSLG